MRWTIVLLGDWSDDCRPDFPAHRTQVCRLSASLYRHSIDGSAAAAHLPHRALDSVGSTLTAATQLPAGARAATVEAAQRAFIHGLDENAADLMHPLSIATEVDL